MRKEQRINDTSDFTLLRGPSAEDLKDLETVKRIEGCDAHIPLVVGQSGLQNLVELVSDHSARPTNPYAADLY